jgi:cytoskeletal protein CcmA (bactofilin family)
VSDRFDKYYKYIKGADIKESPMKPGGRIVSISGAGTLAGGVYERISISGSADITGDIEADSISISGSCDINGKIKADKLEISGAADMKEIDVVVAEISGAVDIDGSISVKRLLRVSGSIDVDGDIISEGYCSLNGAFRVKGSIKGNVIEVMLDGGTSEIDGEVQCSRMRVVTTLIKDLSSILRLLSRRRRGYLYVKRIIADDIHLENTICDEVIGRNVVIGRGCRVDVVKYKENVSIDPSSTVNNVLKSDE